MIMNKKNKIAIIAVVVIAIVAIIYNCVVKPEYDEYGNMIEITTVEAVTEETVQSTTESFTEGTTAVIRPSEATTVNAVVPKLNTSTDIPGGTKVYSPDKYISYNDKRLAVNFSMESLKTILGEPIIFVEETTQPATDVSIEEETQTETSEITTSEAAKPEDGFENSYRYREFIIGTKIENGKEVVKDIRVVSQKVNNLLGFSPIGKYLYEITLTYGQPSYSDWNICKYAIDSESELYFRIDNEKVESWGIAAK